MEATRDEIKTHFEAILKRDDGVFEKWLASAHFLLQRYHLLEYESAGDVLNTLYVKLIDGPRKWDKEKYPDFVIYIFMLIQSSIRNLAETEKKKTAFHGETVTLLQQEHHTPYPVPELMDLCLNELGPDEVMRKIFSAMSEGLPNREVAEELNLNICFVQNMKKRIIRKLMPVFEEYRK
jgi:RNA polymerase sigma factor (sigma-70 family)